MHNMTLKMISAIVFSTVVLLALLSVHDALLLVIAFGAPANWPREATLSTALPGFQLPTYYLPYRLISIGRQIATLGLAGLIVIPTAGLVRSLKNGEPFTSSNITRLRLVALGCSIYGLGPLAISLVPMTIRVPLGLLYGFVNWPAIAMALIALALAEIFNEGMRLREDVQATI